MENQAFEKTEAQLEDSTQMVEEPGETMSPIEEPETPTPIEEQPEAEETPIPIDVSPKSKMQKLLARICKRKAGKSEFEAEAKRQKEAQEEEEKQDQVESPLAFKALNTEEAETPQAPAMMSPALLALLLKLNNSVNQNAEAQTKTTEGEESEDLKEKKNAFAQIASAVFNNPIILKTKGQLEKADLEEEEEAEENDNEEIEVLEEKEAEIVEVSRKRKNPEVVDVEEENEMKEISVEIQDFRTFKKLRAQIEEEFGVKINDKIPSRHQIVLEVADDDEIEYLDAYDGDDEITVVDDDEIIEEDEIEVVDDEEVVEEKKEKKTSKKDKKRKDSDSSANSKDSEDSGIELVDLYEEVNNNNEVKTEQVVKIVDVDSIMKRSKNEKSKADGNNNKKNKSRKQSRRIDTIIL